MKEEGEGIGRRRKRKAYVGRSGGGGGEERGNTKQRGEMQGKQVYIR